MRTYWLHEWKALSDFGFTQTKMWLFPKKLTLDEHKVQTAIAMVKSRVQSFIIEWDMIDICTWNIFASFCFRDQLLSSAIASRFEIKAIVEHS